ncbi:MAG: hypothetical protein QM737_07950 [Ferruginibacter sp.]
MATKKQVSKKGKSKSTMIRIAEKVGEIAGRIMNEKDHLVSIAGEAIDSVKSAVPGLGGKIKKAEKKAAKKPVKKTVKKAAKSIRKKSATKKSASKKTVVAKKVIVKKTAGGKKAAR